MPPCPVCGSTLVYEYSNTYVCPECAHEWSADSPPLPSGPPEAEGAASAGERVVTDANGTPLADGDTVTVIKDLKVRGSSVVVKVGTKVKNIRLTDGDHDIDCKVPGVGAMGLKSAFVRKA